MADGGLAFYDGENAEELEEDDEAIDWGEIFQTPENEWGSFRCNLSDVDGSSRDGMDMENPVSKREEKTFSKEERSEGTIAGQFDNKASNDAKTLTRMELNDHKAGMVGLDKEKINQIIFEASKGSRFYENELKKEKQVAERIAKQTACLEKLTEKQRSEALETADLMVKELETARDLSRTFVHIDMDAFYAAVEILDNPELRDKPMAVGGNAMLSTSNYPARRYGVRAAMPGFIAKKLCPELVILPAHYDKYKEYSRQVQEILGDYDPNFAMASLDEGYLDLTEYLRERQKMGEEKRVFFKSKSLDGSKLDDGKDRETREKSKFESIEFGHGGENRESHHKPEVESVEFGHDGKNRESHHKPEVESVEFGHDGKNRESHHKPEVESVEFGHDGKNRESRQKPEVESAEFGYEGKNRESHQKPEVESVEFGHDGNNRESRQKPEVEAVEFGHDAEEVVRELRFRIEQKTRLTASAGIASNVMLAKVCSDRNKPNGQFLLKPDRDVVLDFVHNLPIRKISGIGRVSEQMLKALGVNTCKDLYTQRDLLYLLHSPISFRFLLAVSLGLGDTSIASDSKRKSRSTETTFAEISKPEELFNMCDKLCQALAEDFKREKLRGKTVTIKLKTVNFDIKQRSLSPRNPVSTYEEIFSAAKELLKNEINASLPEPLRLRLMGVRLSNFQSSTTNSSKEVKQDTITGFLKRKKPGVLLGTPCSVVDCGQLREGDFNHSGTAEELKASDLTKENSMLYEEDFSTGVVSSSEEFSSHLRSSTVASDCGSLCPGPVHCSALPEDTNQTQPPLTCPVCGQEQSVQPGADRMVELNRHIDLCLNKATIREIVSETKAVPASATASVTSLSETGSSQAMSSLPGKKRKRQPSGAPSKKVTLHSFWSK